MNKMSETDVYRPNWFEIYGYEPHTERPQELVSVTRHTADLAQSALKDRMEKEYYNNDEAACRELNDALTSSASQTATGARENEKPCSWIRTADRKPTEEDAGEMGLVLGADEEGAVDVEDWHTINVHPSVFPFWMPIPPVPEGQQNDPYDDPR